MRLIPGDGGYSMRVVIPSISTGGTQVRVSFDSPASPGIALNHVTIGVRNSTYNTVATPVENPLFREQRIFCHRVYDGQRLDKLRDIAGQDLVVVTDNGATSDMSTIASGQSYYLAATASYNSASPAGSWSSTAYIFSVVKVEVR